jgi:hypothetical protein
MRVNKRISNPIEKRVVSDVIIKKEPKKSIETALQKALKIQARIRSI